MSALPFAGTAESFTASDGRPLAIRISGTVLFGAVRPDAEPDARAAEELVLRAATATLTSGAERGEWRLEALASPEAEEAIGRRTEQHLVAGLPDGVTARILELALRYEEAAKRAEPPKQPAAAPAPAQAASRVTAAVPMATPQQIAAAEAAAQRPALAPGARLYVASSDGRWYPATYLQSAPGYVLVDFGGGRLQWVAEAYCAPG